MMDSQNRRTLIMDTFKLGLKDHHEMIYWHSIISVLKPPVHFLHDKRKTDVEANWDYLARMYR